MADIGYVKIQQEKYNDALIYLKKSLAIQKQIKTVFYRVYNYIAKCLSKKSNIDGSLLSDIENLTGLANTPTSYFEYVIEQTTKLNQVFNLIPALYEYGKYLYNKGDKSKGLDKIRLAKEKAESLHIAIELKRIEEIYKELGLNK